MISYKQIIKIETSLHLAGGNREVDAMGNAKWIANKNGWAKPEGTQQPPDFDPLKLRVTEK